MKNIILLFSLFSFTQLDVVVFVNAKKEREELSEAVYAKYQKEIDFMFNPEIPQIEIIEQAMMYYKKVIHPVKTMTQFYNVYDKFLINLYESNLISLDQKLKQISESYFNQTQKKSVNLKKKVKKFLKENKIEKLFKVKKNLMLTQSSSHEWKHYFELQYYYFGGIRNYIQNCYQVPILRNYCSQTLKHQFSLVNKQIPYPPTQEKEYLFYVLQREIKKYKQIGLKKMQPLEQDKVDEKTLFDLDLSLIEHVNHQNDSFNNDIEDLLSEVKTEESQPNQIEEEIQQEIINDNIKQNVDSVIEEEESQNESLEEISDEETVEKQDYDRNKISVDYSYSDYQFSNQKKPSAVQVLIKRMDPKQLRKMVQKFKEKSLQDQEFKKIQVNLEEQNVNYKNVYLKKSRTKSEIPNVFKKDLFYV